MADKNIVDKKTGRFIAGGPQDTNKNGTAGRPTDYSPKFCKMIVEFFQVEPTRITVEKFTKKNGEIYEKETEIPILFPTMIDFAESIDVAVSSLRLWSKLHPDFSAAYARAKQLQENIWVKNSLSPHGYNPQFAIFLGKNVFRYKDKVDTDITTKGEKLNIGVVSYDKIKSEK